VCHFVCPLFFFLRIYYTILLGVCQGVFKNFFIFFYSADWQFFAFFLPTRRLSSLDYHHYYIVKIENEERAIQHNEIQSLSFPTSCCRDERADEEEYIHIESHHYSKSAKCVDGCGDVSYIKLIGFI
jgi:hypothetical protein